MSHPILGLHHVTATVDDAQRDLDFCLDLLGLRLVKKTVNFDNHDVYHFYYGDERGTPGTIWTTFPYKGRGVPIGEKGRRSGHGHVVLGARRVAWLLAKAAPRIAGECARQSARFGEEVLRVDDPSGLVFELVATTATRASRGSGSGIDADERDPWPAQRDDVGPRPGRRSRS